ncbi:MAG: hypothetical protein JWP67_2997, partial [Mucilaginibacter sp.]|nr:hypothetical protein [Mucilaginibacter sp.]
IENLIVIKNVKYVVFSLNIYIFANK